MRMPISRMRWRTQSASMLPIPATAITSARAANRPKSWAVVRGDARVGAGLLPAS